MNPRHLLYFLKGIFVPAFCECDPSTSLEDAGTWDLLVLFRRLLGLRDLVWACGNQFPPCLLQVLHQRLPRCRLHIRAFRLRCIQWSENNRKEWMSASLRLLRRRVCPVSLCQFHAIILIVELTATGKLPCALRQDWLRT